MNNRLQFRYHSEVFDTREEAIKYIQSQIRHADSGLAAQDTSYGYSLLAEPTVLLYKKEEDETDPHLMLVIGSQTNPGIEEGGGIPQYSDNRFCIIDIDKTEQEIADIAEELEKAIKSLTVITQNSDTLNLYANKTEDGTFMSGDVKVAESYIYEDIRYKNNLFVTPDGIFFYINLDYDEENERFTFSVSNGEGEITKTAVSLFDNYLVSGYYDKTDESIHLQLRDGEEVVVDCEDLIAEWGVEGEASDTPVVLTREEVDYSDDDEHHHVEPWQDVLRADVRIKDETKTLMPDGKYKYEKDVNSTNILDRTLDGRYLYVDGKAENIIYYSGGTKTTVKDTLDDLLNIKLSSDNDNIIIDKADGFFASTKLEYISSENKLVFKASGQPDKEIELNSVELFEHVYYDRTREVLVLTYKDNTGQTQFVEIPIGEMIREWQPQNEGHNVKLVRSINVAGNDKVSADVKILNDEDNILVDKNHELFVKGTADNIKYEDSTVKGALDGLRDKDNELDAKIDAEIARATSVENTLQDEIDAVSADSANSLKSISNIDKSIDVDDTDHVNPVIKVNISGHEDNTIRLIQQEGIEGLYNFVDLSYDSDHNKLTFVRSTSGTTDFVKEIQLQSVSFIEEIYYDKNTEELVIVYWSGHDQKVIKIPMRDLIDEWDVYNDVHSAVVLTKVWDTGLTKNILSAEVKVSNKADNILENQEGELYVSNSSITANAEAIAAEAARAQEAERGLSDKIDAETARAEGAEANLNNAIEAEITRATNAETALQTAINNEVIRATSAETALQTAIGNEVTRATHKESDLEDAIQREEARARETEGRIEIALNNEISRATTKDDELYEAITNETIDRTTADTNLQSQISQEVSRAQVAENTISERLTSEITRSKSEDERLTDALEQEITDRQQGDAELAEEIRASKLVFSSTTSIDFNNPYLEDNVVKANIRLQGGNNIIKLGSGLYATVDLSYDPGTNKIRLVTSNGPTEEIQLVGASLLEDLHYDPVNKALVITYKDATGTEHTVQFGVSELFNEWSVNNPSEKSAIELTKSPAAEPGGEDKLSGRILITDDLNDDGKPDDGSPNIVEIRNNGLFVDGTPIEETKEMAECTKNEIKVLEKAIIGHQIGEECGSGYTYEKDTLANYINTATSFYDSDRILDKNLKRVEDYVNEVSAKTDCVDSKTDKTYQLLYGPNAAMPACGEGLVYKPYVGACVISAATSFDEADHLLNDQICEILTMWVSGKTCSTESAWVDDGANRRMQVDVRLSRGRFSEMTDDDVYIDDLSGDYIDPTTNEFTDTNVLRIACIKEAPSGTTPSIDSMQNGVYLSNKWDCGLYYDANTPEDQEAKARASAAGYIVAPYSSDSDPSASDYNYNNYVRQTDIPLH